MKETPLRDIINVSSIAELDKIRDRFMKSELHHFATNTDTMLQVISKDTRCKTTYIVKLPKFKTFTQGRFFVVIMHDDDDALVQCMASSYDDPKIMELGLRIDDLPRVLRNKVVAFLDTEALEYREIRRVGEIGIQEQATFKINEQ